MTGALLPHRCLCVLSVRPRVRRASDFLRRTTIRRFGVTQPRPSRGEVLIPTVGRIRVTTAATAATAAKAATAETTAAPHQLFESSKSLVLEALEMNTDRSMKGTVDEQIKPLLHQINSTRHLYTTSSCAGRIQILGMMKRIRVKNGDGSRVQQHDNSSNNNDSSDKYRPYWIYQSHSGITGNSLRELYHRVSNTLLSTSQQYWITGNSLRELYHRVSNTLLSTSQQSCNPVLLDEKGHQRHNETEKHIRSSNRNRTGDDVGLMSTERISSGVEQRPIVEEVLYIPEEHSLLTCVELRLVCQGPILHIATPTVEIGNHLMQQLQAAGLKQTMIRSITKVRVIVSCTSSTNLSALLWLNRSVNNSDAILTGCWLMDLSAVPLSDTLAHRVTLTMLHSRTDYFDKVESILGDPLFNT